MEHLFPQCFDGFIVDASISARPLLGGCAMYPQVLGIGSVYKCSHGNGASIPVVFWCRSSPFCISLHLYPTLFKAPLAVRLHIYSDKFWPGVHGVTHTQELIYCGSRVIPFWGIVCKTFQEQLIAGWHCPRWLFFPLKTWLQPAEPCFIKVFDDQKILSRKKDLKSKMV